MTVKAISISPFKTAFWLAKLPNSLILKLNPLFLLENEFNIEGNRKVPSIGGIPKAKVIFLLVYSLSFSSTF